MDPELEAIRAKRLAQMKQGAGMAGLPAGLPSGLPQMQKQEQEKPEEDEMRRTILASILDNSARERLARISIVKQDKARQVEEMLIRMAQSGQIRGKTL
ncbi:PDCD5-related protein [Gorgonomyces haynaldii]|nr:PDCD5-related protein [Gorgonomyces haynaldii]